MSHNNNIEGKKRDIKHEREKSRRDYLSRRTEKQVEVIDREVKRHKFLADDETLTSRERKDLVYKEKILKLTKNRLEAGEQVKIQQYLLPDSAGIKDDYQQFEEKDRPHNYEEKLWEQEKFRLNQLKYADKKKSKHKLLDDEDRRKESSSSIFSDPEKYELLMQDTEFLEQVKRDDNLVEKYEEAIERHQQKVRESARDQIKATRRALPVYEWRGELLQTIRDNKIVLIQGETGCGKTTQVPQYLHEDGWTKTELKDGVTKMVGCTQPRRVAAMAVAYRVSQELGTKLGNSVGYSIRFEDCTCEGTVIKYMTDGMLLRELLDDPILEKYSVIIIDEAHERTLHTDILLTLMKDVTKMRHDFRLVISSATLDAEKFLSFFNNPPMFHIKGRRFPVKNLFLPPTQKEATTDYLQLALRTIKQIHATGEPGDILVFLPGQEEIETLQRNIEENIKASEGEFSTLLLRPIYANLPTDQQAKVFEPTPKGMRKVVIATNIAETSLTINGIVFVIDPGYCKQNKFNSRNGIETLAVTRISKASADQRAGRAGRVQPGTCFRLYSRIEYMEEFPENTMPEIQRVNLGNVVLLLKTMKVKDVINFEYMDAPSKETVMFALEQLTFLGALDQGEDLTPLGRRMAEFPIDPKMSKSIIAAENFGCSEDVISIIAMLNLNAPVFFKPKGKALLADSSRKSFFSNTGDHITLLKVYDDWAANEYSSQWCYERFVQHKSMCRARDVREQLENLCEKAEVALVSKSQDNSDILKAILSGYFYNVARISRDGGSYRTIKKNNPVYIHPTSALFGDVPTKWVMFNEVMMTTKEYMRTVSQIQPDWLTEVAPSFYSKDEIEELNQKRMSKLQNRGKSNAQLNPKYGPLT